MRAANPQDPEMNRPIKKVSFKRNIAIPITAAAAADSSASAFVNMGRLNMGSVNIQDEPVRTTFDFEHDSVRARSGFLGKAQPAASSEDWERARIEDFPGFDYIPWDGRFVSAMCGLSRALTHHPIPHSTTRPILSSDHDKVIAILVGRPNGEDWMRGVNEPLMASFEEVRAAFKASANGNRRGDFASMASGISYGGGQKVRGHPMPLDATTYGRTAEAQ